MPEASPARLTSLDQFRGYTVVGMCVVNWLGEFRATPEILKHHRDWCSYADTIMPQFLFAAGFALRLVLTRPAATAAPAAAHWRAVRRCLGLLVFGLIVYQLDGDWRAWDQLTAAGWTGFFAGSFWRNPWQALVHIAVTCLWILPVIARGVKARIAFALLSAGLHLWLSQLFWFDLLRDKNVIDGGPLGFLTWSLPAIAGTLAYDAIKAGWKMSRLACWGGIAMACGYGLSCFGAGGHAAPPPFFPARLPHDIWTMSQKAGSVSYLLFSAGWCLAFYALFRVFCDFRSWKNRLFDDFGINALAAYVLHLTVMEAVIRFAPPDAPLWWALTTGALHFGLVWWMVRWLNAKGMFLRL